ncbi:hypothetical protein TIFTF001_024696 [Ficus carica]|uniref:THO complex subunit 1 n=1 Tax=Ficus carica TaxID=3494 RepID=A0AA88DKF0_FICCA|nr:hypothetical protein TIFTF001_024696 [Ficus carica]
MQYGQSIDEEGSTQSHIPRLLDIVLYLCEKEHIEGGMIFQLLEDLTEISTMRNCKDIFGYIESKQDVLGKANDVVFCGRILMFLAHFFPLSERSAVNIKGVFNTSNVTKYEKDPPDGISIDFNFYKTFWSLQPEVPQCGVLLVSLVDLEGTLLQSCFPSSYSTEVAEICVQFNGITKSPCVFRFRYLGTALFFTAILSIPISDEEGDANNLEEEAANFSIKYLTSSKLMSLELKDPSFRRHILVQCLILFDYLKAPGKNEKDLPSESMVSVVVMNVGKDEIKSYEEHAKKLLEMTPPKGKDFLNKVEHILEREKNWVWWKRDGCPPFEKQPIEKKVVQDGAKKRRPRWRMGNKELSQLWKWADQNPNALSDPQRVRTPSITEYWKPLAEDMDPAAGIEADYHHKNNRVYCWKGLRFSARQDLDGFSRFTDHGIEGVVPLELLPPEFRAKYQAKPNERSKRAKKEEAKDAAQQGEENQIATPASEIDEGIRPDLEASAMPMDAETTTGTGNTSLGGSPMPDEQQKQSPDTDAGQETGQLEADAEVGAGMIDGEPDTEVDLDPTT